MPTNAVLCYIRANGRVLLQRKAPGRFGGGYWNAPGGKIADGETAAAAARREVLEETGLTVHDLRDHGTVTFYLDAIEEPDIIVHVFTAEGFEGALQPSQEGPLDWFLEDRLPYDEMWEDDRLWLPHVLAGRRVRGWFWFSAGYERLLRHELTVEP